MRSVLDVLVPAVVVGSIFLVVALWLPGLAAVGLVVMIGVVVGRLVRGSASDRA